MSGLSRRDFFRTGGRLAAGLGASTGALTIIAPPTSAKERGTADSEALEQLAEKAAGQAALLYDATLCIGCRACELACNEKNQLGRTDDEIFAGRPAEDARALAPDVWTYVTFHQIEGDPSTASWGKVQCMHCIEPACVSSCPVVALEKTEEGPVIYNQYKCLGCRYCELACPFLVPRFEWETWNPYIRKCDMCYDRQQEGKPPACVEACPTGALLWGTREELLADAKARIEASPRTYVHHVYGEHEAGGTAFLHLAGRPFDELGYRRNLPLESYREYTKQSMLSVPYVLSTLALALGSVAWMVNRTKIGSEHGKSAEAGPAEGEKGGAA